MRRSALLVATTMLLVLVAAGGVALAVTQTCTTNPCEGTSGPDTLYERAVDGYTGTDTIYGKGADDDIIATEHEGDTDTLYGGPAVDVLNAQDHDVRDTLNGGKSFDLCYIDLDTSTGDQDATTGCENVRVLAIDYE